MRHIYTILCAVCMAIGVQAQNSIVGDWKTVDDKTGDNYSIVASTRVKTGCTTAR